LPPTKVQKEKGGWGAGPIDTRIGGIIRTRVLRGKGVGRYDLSVDMPGWKLGEEDAGILGDTSKYPFSGLGKKRHHPLRSALASIAFVHWGKDKKITGTRIAGGNPSEKKAR